MDTEPSYNFDSESIRRIVEHAERLSERLGQLKATMADETDSPSVNAALQGIITAAGDILSLRLSKTCVAASASSPPTAAAAALSTSMDPGGGAQLRSAVEQTTSINPATPITTSIPATPAVALCESSSTSPQSQAKEPSPLARADPANPQDITGPGTDELTKRTQLPDSRRSGTTESDSSNINKKRGAETSPLDDDPKRPKINATSRDTHEMDRLTRKLRYNDKLLPESSLDIIRNSSTAVMVRRAAAAQGGPAIRQFCSLIFERRSRESETGILHLKSRGVDRALELSNSIAALTRKTIYGAFLIRLAQYHIAAAVDETKMGRIRADPVEIRDAMDRFGWKPAEKARFFQTLRQGRQWRAVCGPLPGLLCLIPLRAEKPYSMAPKDYLAMRRDEVDEFTAIMGSSGFLRHLNSACETFQAVAMGTASDRTFRWEREHPQLRTWHDGMDESILAMLLQPEPVCDENFILPGDLDKWPKPPAWREEWPWPAHPLAVAPSDRRQCGLCDDKTCSCISDRFRTAWPPRIKWYGKLGVGLQAVAGHEGDLSYRKGDLIGQLSGRLQPAGTYAANSLWVVEMHRPDMAAPGDDAGPAPPICQIYVGGAASVFRNMNHCCRASVRMLPVKASGVWVMAVEAVRDIRHGEQLTVNFGKRFLRDQGLRCECEQCAPGA